VSIDFGYSFGHGLRLQIPELSPFRLTPCFEGFLYPHSSPEGVYLDVLARCLETLRENQRDVIDSCRIFCTDPVTNWELEPEFTVEIVKKKLRGENPVKIMLLELSRTKLPWVLNELDSDDNCFLDLLFGVEGTRRRGKELQLSFRDQAFCLVELARDENLLTRAWQGWSPLT